MAWIEFHAAKIKRLQKFRDFRAEMGWSTNEALGFLGSFWGEVIELREDGNITGWKPDYIAELTAVDVSPDKLWSALVSNHWIEDENGRILIHDWLDTAGLFLSRKYSTSNRKRLVNIWRTHGRSYASKIANNKRTVSEQIANLPNQPNLTNQTIPNLTKPKDIGPEFLGLAQRLFNLILENDSGAKPPASFDGWASDAEKIVRLDKRGFEEIKEVLEWCQRHYFWKTNILSMATFREKFPKLLLQMKGEKNGPNRPQKHVGAAAPVPNKYQEGDPIG